MLLTLREFPDIDFEIKNGVEGAEHSNPSKHMKHDLTITWSKVVAIGTKR